jgi:hypothetical protein
VGPFGFEKRGSPGSSFRPKSPRFAPELLKPQRFSALFPAPPRTRLEGESSGWKAAQLHRSWSKPPAKSHVQQGGLSFPQKIAFVCEVDAGNVNKIQDMVVFS